MVNELLNYKACVDLLNNDNETALHISCKQNRADMIKSLIEYAKELNKISNFDYTPLKYLIENIQPNKISTIISLIQCGADCNLIRFNNSSRFNQNNNNNDNQTESFNENITCLDYLFKIYENSFKSNSDFKVLIEILELIINSGYKLSLNDFNIFKVAPLFNHSNNQRLLFLNYYKTPNLLVNLCRIKIRSLLKKPYINSIKYLHIPLLMKEFLYFK